MFQGGGRNHIKRNTRETHGKYLAFTVQHREERRPLEDYRGVDEAADVPGGGDTLLVVDQGQDEAQVRSLLEPHPKG